MAKTAKTIRLSEQTSIPADSTDPASVSTDGAGRPADLVLEGGGVKGIGLAGAVLALDRAGYRFQRVAGTSAGAIAAALIAALNAKKQPLSQLTEILRSVEYPRFMAKGHLRAALGRIGDAEQLLVHMGLYDGDYLVEWLGDALRQIGVTKFGQLSTVGDLGADARWSEAQRFSLVVHVSDITRGKLVRLPWDYPVYGRDPAEELIVDAVRASMSIPFFFDPVRFRAPQAVIDGITYQPGRVTWVDGGMLSNFPIEVFDRSDGTASRWQTIGIKLSAQSTTISCGTEIDNVFEEATACIHTLLDNADRYYVTPDKAARTIFVDNSGIKATDFGLTQAQQNQLLANGKGAAEAWIAKQHTKKTKTTPAPV